MHISMEEMYNYKTHTNTVCHIIYNIYNNNNYFLIYIQPIVPLHGDLHGDMEIHVAE